MYIHTYPEPICPTSHPLCPPSSAGSRSYSSPDFHRATRVSCRDKTLWANALFFFFFPEMVMTSWVHWNQTIFEGWKNQSVFLLVLSCANVWFFGTMLLTIYKHVPPKRSKKYVYRYILYTCYICIYIYTKLFLFLWKLRCDGPFQSNTFCWKLIWRGT